MTLNWFMVGAAWIPFFVVSAMMWRQWHVARAKARTSRSMGGTGTERPPVARRAARENGAATRDTHRPPALQLRAPRSPRAELDDDVARIPQARVPNIELPHEGCMDGPIDEFTELPRLVFEEDYSEPPPSFPRWSGPSRHERREQPSEG